MNNIKSTATGDNKNTNSDQPSNTDLMSSAKVVAEAAQCAATNQTENIDKTKVAGAGADLLDSVKQYGKFDESEGAGQYIKQAEDYLHKYGTQAPALATEEKKGEVPVPTPVEDEKKDDALTPAPLEEKKAEAPVPVPGEEEKVEAPVRVPQEEEKVGASVPVPDDEEEEKKGGKDESGSGIGAGDAVKAAGNFFK